MDNDLLIYLRKDKSHSNIAIRKILFIQAYFCVGIGLVAPRAGGALSGADFAVARHDGGERRRPPPPPRQGWTEAGRRRRRRRAAGRGRSVLVNI